MISARPAQRVRSDGQLVRRIRRSILVRYGQRPAGAVRFGECHYRIIRSIVQHLRARYAREGAERNFGDRVVAPVRFDDPEEGSARAVLALDERGVVPQVEAGIVGSRPRQQQRIGRFGGGGHRVEAAVAEPGHLCRIPLGRAGSLVPKVLVAVTRAHGQQAVGSSLVVKIGAQQMPHEPQRHIVLVRIRADHAVQIEHHRIAEVFVLQQHYGALERRICVSVLVACAHDLVPVGRLEEVQVGAIGLAALHRAAVVRFAVDHHRIMRHALLGEGVVFGQIAPAALLVDVDPARRAIVLHHLALVVVNRVGELVEVTVTHAVRGVFQHQRQLFAVGVIRPQNGHAALFAFGSVAIIDRARLEGLS